MSVTDPIVIAHDPTDALPFSLSRGPETFYDEDRYQRRWKYWQDARDWARRNLGVSPPEPMRQRGLFDG